MARRALGLVAAVVVVVAAAVVARPPAREHPPPFTVERATPSPRAAPSAPEPSASAPATPARGGRASLAVHRLDPRTLEVRGEAVSLPLSPGRLSVAFSPDGGRFAVAATRAQPEVDTVLRLYDTGRLERAPPELFVSGLVDWLAFTPDGGGIVWLESHFRAFLQVGGLRLTEGGTRRLPGVQLPVEGRVHSLAALAGERVGLVMLAAGGSREAVGVRLVVVDLGEGEVGVDLPLPVAPPLGAAGERLPGVAWDAARDRVYVAHADRDAVLAVDLADPDGGVELAGPAPPASAPVGAVSRQAVLSDDGSMLYVHGAVRAGAGEDAGAGPTPGALPLVAVDVEAGAVLDLNRWLPARVLGASAGAARVAVVTGTPGSGPELTLRVLDGRTLAERWQRPLADPVPPWTGFGAGGAVLAVAGDDVRGEGATTHLHVLESASGAEIARARFAGSFVDMHLDAGLLLLRASD